MWRTSSQLARRPMRVNLRFLTVSFGTSMNFYRHDLDSLCGFEVPKKTIENHSTSCKVSLYFFFVRLMDRPSRPHFQFKVST